MKKISPWLIVLNAIQVTNRSSLYPEIQVLEIGSPQGVDHVRAVFSLATQTAKEEFTFDLLVYYYIGDM